MPDRQQRRDHAGILGLEDESNAAKYEDGVFKPLEEVKLTEGTKVEVHVPGKQPRRRPKSAREFAAFGMWADRDHPRWRRVRQQPAGAAVLIARKT